MHDVIKIIMFLKLLNDMNIQSERILAARRRRRQRMKRLLLAHAHQISARKKGIAEIVSMLTKERLLPPRVRSCRRYPRNAGWWENVWGNYDDRRFKEAFWVTRGTFIYIAERIRGKIEKESLTEDAISTEKRLAICLYRLARGDYMYTIAELTGVGEATVCNIVIEVCEALVSEFWLEKVKAYFPNNIDAYRQSAENFEVMWQYGFTFGVIDGCHLPAHTRTLRLPFTAQFPTLSV